MKTKIETDTYPNGKKMHETPYVNGKAHGLVTWWHENGQKWHEIPFVNGQQYGLETWWYESGQKWSETPYVNGQEHGLVIGWNINGSLRYVEKMHQDQLVWEINFPSQEQISENAEVELFFHETPELK